MDYAMAIIIVVGIALNILLAGSLVLACVKEWTKYLSYKAELESE